MTVPGVKPITVYVHSAGPNPFKVVIILEELNLPYKKIVVDNPKEEWFTAINPNGRVPAIEDPNTKQTIWESGAIVEYLVETYDAKGLLTLRHDPATKWQIRQYLQFQMSGQGPYYGQAVWFQKCPEDIPVAKERYVEQIARVFGVLDGILAGREYLLGGEVTYADLAFVPWDIVALNAPFFREPLMEGYHVEERYPNFLAWHRRLASRPAVVRAYAGDSA